MPSNKPRLYVALYISGVINNEERKYHWAFIIGPKVETEPEVPGMRYHVKNAPVVGWKYEEAELGNVKKTNTLLARILIAKIEDEERLVKIFRSAPVVNNDANWRCRTWVADVLATINKDGKAVGTSELDWKKIEALAREYVGKKTAAKRYESVAELDLPRPTFDLIQGKEILR